MAAIAKTAQYGVITTTYPTTMVYYVFKYLCNSFTLQEDTNTEGKVSNSGELSVRYE